MIFGRGGGGGVINRVDQGSRFSPLRAFTLQAGAFDNSGSPRDLDQPLTMRRVPRSTACSRDPEASATASPRADGVQPDVTFAPDAQTKSRSATSTCATRASPTAA